MKRQQLVVVNFAFFATMVAAQLPSLVRQREATIIKKNATGQLMPFMLSAHYLDLSQRQSFIPIIDLKREKNLQKIGRTSLR